MADLAEWDIDDFSDFVHRRARDIESAMRRAARSMGVRLKNAVISELVRRYGVKSGDFGKVRVRLIVRRGVLDAKVWIGSNAVPIEYLKPRITGTGVSAGGREYAGAFVVKSRKGVAVNRLLIMRRTGGGRLPIERMSEDINNVVVQEIANRWGWARSYFFRETRRILETTEK